MLVVKLAKLPLYNDVVEVTLPDDDLRHNVPNEKGLVKLTERISQEGLGLDIDGDMVQVLDKQGKPLGTLYWHQAHGQRQWIPSPDEHRRMVYHSEEFCTYLDEMQAAIIGMVYDAQRVEMNKTYQRLRDMTLNEVVKYV